jgi:hypothetical protein
MTDVLDPDYWRRLAAESRATAQALQDHVAKVLALKMAGVYDDMAGRAAQLLRRAEEQEPLTPSGPLWRSSP